MREKQFTIIPTHNNSECDAILHNTFNNAYILTFAGTDTAYTHTHAQMSSVDGLYIAANSQQNIGILYKTQIINNIKLHF